jgi:hypothetical protein
VLTHNIASSPGQALVASLLYEDEGQIVLVPSSIAGLVMLSPALVTGVGVGVTCGIAVGFMMLFSGKISKFVEKHSTIKMLALSFLLLIGMALIGDGFDMHIPKGYIYFAMAFSVFVEMLNLRLQQGTPVKLHQPHLLDSDEQVKFMGLLRCRQALSSQRGHGE